MSDTIRQQIIDNLVGRLSQMSIANGYSVDYATAKEWPLEPLETVDLPCVSIYDTENNVSEPFLHRSFTAYVLSVVIAINVMDGVVTSTKQLRNNIHDVYMCIGKDLSCGGFADMVRPKGDVIDLLQKENVYGAIEIKFDIEYQVTSFDQTSQ